MFSFIESWWIFVSASTLCHDLLEKAMAPHSSVLAWRIPGMAEPSGLPSMGSQSWTRLKRLSSSSSMTYCFGLMYVKKIQENHFFLNSFINLFLAVLSLHCCVGFSLVAANVQNSCRGFCCCGAQALGAQASIVVTCGLSSCGA